MNLPVIENADEIVRLIDAGNLTPRSRSVCLSYAAAMPVLDKLQQDIIEASKRGDPEMLRFREELRKRIDAAASKQGPWRICWCLILPDAEVDWELAEYLILWGRESGLSDVAIINAFGVRAKAARSDIPIRKATPADHPRALEIWRTAVDATHAFLTPEHRADIDIMVERDHLPNVDLWVATDETGTVQAFLGMGDDEIDSLFVDPAMHGRGYGSALVAHALRLVPNAKVDASEQTLQAIAFYESRGFIRTGRSETDPMGRPYPLIHFRYPG